MSQEAVVENLVNGDNETNKEQGDNAPDDAGTPDKEKSIKSVEEIPKERIEEEHVEDEHSVKVTVEEEKEIEEKTEVKNVEGGPEETPILTKRNAVEREKGETENVDREKVESKHIVDKEQLEGEHLDGEHVDGEEHTLILKKDDEMGDEWYDGEEDEEYEDEGYKYERFEYEKFEYETYKDEGYEYEVYEGEEYDEEERNEEETKKEEEKPEEESVEEEQYYETPVDPAAPLDLSDSKEALKPPYELSPEQLAQVEKLWDLFMDYTPAYADLDQFITLKELVYMLNSLFLMTYTEEQLMELVTFVCRPPDDNGHITYDQFLRMVKIRWRDMEQIEEVRFALQFLDPAKTGEVEASELEEILGKLGNKMPSKMINNFIKEVNIGGEGKIGIEDVVAIVGIDLATDDMMTTQEPEEEDNF